MYDILSNHKVEVICSVASQDVGNGTFPTTEIDLFTDGLANRLLLIIDVTSVGTGGTLDLVAQDSEDDATYDADFVTFAQIDEAGTYIAVIDDPNRYFRVKATVGTDGVTWGAYMVTFEEQRRPVAQSETTITGTYGTGRTPKVATT